MEKKKIAVVMGGVSPEHEVSLRSGQTVLQHLSRERFRTMAVVIQPDGRWSMTDGEAGPGARAARFRDLRPDAALSRLVEWGVDAAFLALHGPNGEDGTIQGFFQIAGIPYTGPDVEACALSMNKYQSKVLAARDGVRTPPGALVSQEDWKDHRERILKGLQKGLVFPLFVKPLRLGSSIGMERITSGDGLPEVLERCFAFGGEVLVEEAISGREITCALLGNADSGLRVLPAVEIRPKGGAFFDYKSKYDPEKAEEICPAPIDREEQEELERTALSLGLRMGSRGVTRLDFILNGEGFWFLELNAIPGLTPESIVPKEAAAAGISLECLMETVVWLALGRGLDGLEGKEKDKATPPGGGAP